jgi:hypothetical protein
MSTSSPPWYSDGLAFSCTRCGDCCTGSPGYVWVRREEIEGLARFLGMSVEAFGRRYLRRVGRKLSLLEKSNGDCVFYDRGCTVYPARPTQCRTFPFWTENLASASSWSEAARECPGIGRGRLIPLEEIRRIERAEAAAGGGG